jgi:adenylate kinase
MNLSFSVTVGFFCFLFLGTSCAFVPAKTSPALWGISQSETRLLAVTSEDIDAFRLLGGKQLKRTARVLKRKANSATALKSLPEKQSSPTKPASEWTVGKALKIIIAGAPASGKGTQCEIIKDKYGVVHLSTGDMLRAAVAAETEVGKLAKEYMDSGKLVPDEVIIGVVRDSNISFVCANGLFDMSLKMLPLVLIIR